MSGIYIPGMAMPTSCYLCPVNKDDGFGFFTCGVTHSECDFINLPSNCPLVPVPEHGRLIDADALFDFILNIYKAAQGDARKAYSDVLDTIVAAGDVIPADKEGKG